MDRRTFLKTTTAAAGSSLAVSAAAAKAGADAADWEVAAPALSRNIKELSFATAWAPDVPVRGDAAARMAGRLQLALGDGYRIRLDGGSSEDADLTFASPDVDREVGYAFFAGLPGSFGFQPAHLQAWLAAGGGQLLWDDLAAQHGTRPLLAGHTGARPGLWASRPLREAPDFKHGPMVLPDGRLLARMLRGDAVDLPPAEMCRALADGRLVAVEWGNPLAGLAIGLPNAARIFYRGGVHRAGVATALNVRLSLWEQLGSAERLALEGVAAHELALALAEAIAHEQLAEQAMVRVPTLSIQDFPRALAVDVDLTTEVFIDVIGSSSRDAARIRDSYLAFRRLLPELEPSDLSA